MFPAVTERFYNILARIFFVENMKSVLKHDVRYGTTESSSLTVKLKLLVNDHAKDGGLGEF